MQSSHQEYGRSPTAVFRKTRDKMRRKLTLILVTGGLVYTRAEEVHAREVYHIYMYLSYYLLRQYTSKRSRITLTVTGKQDGEDYFSSISSCPYYLYTGQSIKDTSTATGPLTNH